MPTTALTDAQVQAVDDFVRIVLGRLKNDGGVHAETAVSAAASMAGTYLIRSFALPIGELEAGRPFPSAQAEEHGPALVASIVAKLAALELQIDTAGLPTEVPEDHLPQLSLMQIQLMFGVPYRKAIRGHALSEREAAFASAIAAARIIKDCAPVLSPSLALTIAIKSCTQGTTTVPIKVPGDDSGAPGKPWYKFW